MGAGEEPSRQISRAGGFYFQIGSLRERAWGGGCILANVPETLLFSCCLLGHIKRETFSKRFKKV